MIRSNSSSEPRICLATFSAFARQVFRAASYEAQDVLVGCDDVDVVQLEASKRQAWREQVVRRLVYHDVFQQLASLNPGLLPVRLTKYYDLFILSCPFLRDVLYVNAIQGWKDRCKISVCWIEEWWANTLPDVQYLLPILSKFDHVIVGTAGSAKVLGNAIGRPYHEMQGGVDTVRFSPHPNPAARVVDVYSIGRRWEGIHQRLLDSADRLFYLHDTIDDAAVSETRDPARHRSMYANIAKRSRFFMVAPGKMDSPEETQGQIALGYRYFEGSAAGAVLLGQPANCEAFRQHFDWPQAVVEIKPDGSDTMEVISRLSAEPERLRAMSRRNAEEALRRHDWVYRWRDILGIAGLKPTHAMEMREKTLGELADGARA